MPRGKQISPELRARVVAELLTGARVNATARKYKMGRQTVSRLRQDIGEERLGQVGTVLQTEIDALLLECLRSHIKALGSIADTVSKEEYLLQQSAKGLAALYCALSDTVLRIIETGRYME